LGAYNLKTQDYMYGEIFRGQERVCEIEANYMGFFDFDGVRYWDIREKEKTWFKVESEELDPLPSDSTKRTDGIALRTKTIEEA